MGAFKNQTLALVPEGSFLVVLALMAYCRGGGPLRKSLSVSLGCYVSTSSLLSRPDSRTKVAPQDMRNWVKDSLSGSLSANGMAKGEETKRGTDFQRANRDCRKGMGGGDGGPRRSDSSLKGDLPLPAANSCSNYGEQTGVGRGAYSPL